MSQDRLEKALARAKQWMKDNEAGVLVENLAGGATEAELDAAAAKLGFSLPQELRDLWSIHNGQHEELNGFIEAFDLFDIQRALEEQESLEMHLDVAELLDAADDPDIWEEVGLLEEEISMRWVTFAGRDRDVLFVNADSGRVFSNCDWSIMLEAESITEWFEMYADDMESGKYVVEAGFGDCYLEYA